MNRWAKSGIVLAGYLVAFVMSGVAVAIYDHQFTPADNQAMGGMIAGGEMMYGTAVFLLAALPPTGLALWFLRGSRRFWSVFAWGCLAFAGAGLAAILSTPVLRVFHFAHEPYLLVGLLGIVHMLGSPIWIAGFALFALLAPARPLRRRLLVAVAIELACGACGIVHFTMTRPPI